jgi:hypothetical protein
MTEKFLHPALPPLPVQMKNLPVDARGFPVPWFVEWFHKDGTPFQHVDAPIRPEDGDYPDFRVVDARKKARAVRYKLCWVCGGALGVFKAFVIGPMCAVNRTSGEPPAHRDCGIFSAQGCPFLTKPGVERRVNNLPADSSIHPGNLDRNPGVAMVWITKSYKVHQDEDGVLFRIGEPEEIFFFAEGRIATRKQIMHSIDTGMPFLREIAEAQGEEAVKMLGELYEDAIKLVPAA